MDQNFPFPYQPYNIQTNFMSHLYTALEKGKIGLFESPTGTGKSLSLICGSMKWLRDHETELIKQPKEKELELPPPKLVPVPSTGSDSDDDLDVKSLEASMPAWMKASHEKKLVAEEEKEKVKRKEVIQKQRSRLKRIREEEEVSGRARKKIKTEEISLATKQQFTAKTIKPQKRDHLLEDYHSDDEIDDPLKKHSEILKEIDQMTKIEELDQQLVDESQLRVRKIYYCSRTHSQLTQVVNEMKQTAWGKDCKLVSLGSRKNLCINPDVNTTERSSNQVNDLCLDINKKSGSKKSKESGCSYYAPHYERLFIDQTLAMIRDIEDLNKMGESIHCCPYYGTRASIHDAEFVTLPYQALLHKDTREQLGIDIKDNIVIIDEAHNLIESINQMHSVQLSLKTLSQAYAQLYQYDQKYQNRLNWNNKQYIQKVLYLIQQLIKFMMIDDDLQQTIGDSIVSQHDFSFKTHIDNINLFKIHKYMKNSDIIKKVNGFCEDFEVEIQDHRQLSMMNQYEEAVRHIQQYASGIHITASEFQKHRPALGQVASFLAALLTKGQDSVIKVQRVQSEVASKSNRTQSDINLSSIQFVLLNPEIYFQEVVNEARAVILAGGTMQPFSQITHQLFRTQPQQLERIEYFSCGHVIPKDNLLTVIMSSGPSGHDFKFDYTHRSDQQMMIELGSMVANLCHVIPHGVVIFFTSYHYEEQVHKVWEQAGIAKRIQQKKRLFREPRTSSVDEVLQQYSDHILGQDQGAMLSCVIGGKMSEGINFKDALGRCVIVVGLPYPNQHDPLLKCKLDYINNTQKIGNGFDGSQFYENLCMNAVNQTVGRSIRHAGDYATIVLCDLRYKRSEIQQKLPGWIHQSLSEPLPFSQNFKKINQFFQQKKQHPK